MSDQLLNDVERPRILVRLTDSDIAEQVAEIFSWPGTISRWDNATPLHWAEWDAIITDEPPLQSGMPAGRSRFIPDGIPVFFIQHNQTSGLVEFERGISPTGMGRSRLVRQATGGSNLFLGVDGVEEDIVHLTRRTLFKDVNSRPRQWGFKTEVDDLFDSNNLTVTPFLKARGDVVLAGTYTRGDGITNWIIPNDTSVVPWIRIALERWSRELPAVFPAAPGWEHSATWMLPRERELQHDIDHERAFLVEAQKRHDKAVKQLEADKVAQTEQGDIGLRRLLTASGSDLVDAVRHAMAEIGFEVNDMDDVYSAGQRHEDLQLTCPGAAEFLAITEVTGVARGVSQDKWTKLNQHLVSYLRRPESLKSATPWLFVNQHIATDPASRPPLWQKDFWPNVVESGGLAIETPALFELVNGHRSGLTTAQAILDLLVGFNGVLNLSVARAFIQAAETPIQGT